MPTDQKQYRHHTTGVIMAYRIRAVLYYSYMRLIAALCAFVVLGLGVVYVWQYYDTRYALTINDAAYATLMVRSELDRLLVVGTAFAFVVALLVYLLISLRAQARRLAYTLSRDISFSKEQFRRFYELSPVPYLLLEGSTIKRPNKAALRFFGTTEEGLAGKELFSYFSLPEHDDELAMYAERVSRRLPIEQKELLVTHGDGQRRWTLVSIEDLTVPGGQERSSLVTLVDIHEQKELERIKTEFLSLASHQLRAPLANMKWYMDFLLTRRKDKLEAEIEGYLRKMYRRNEDMIDLVGTFLNLSRIEMGRVKIERATTDIVPVVRGVIEELDAAAREKALTLHVELPEAATLDTDGRMVRVIVQNLLSNAVRYTPQGGEIGLTLAVSRARATISVRDTGIGIPPEEQGKIFSKLYRATNAQAMEANGNGIGLYMCKALAEGLGGSLQFTSALGKGTTFTVELSA